LAFLGACLRNLSQFEDDSNQQNSVEQTPQCQLVLAHFKSVDLNRYFQLLPTPAGVTSLTLASSDEWWPRNPPVTLNKSRKASGSIALGQLPSLQT
jgi:hypothetical protein